MCPGMEIKRTEMLLGRLHRQYTQSEIYEPIGGHLLFAHFILLYFIVSIKLFI